MENTIANFARVYGLSYQSLFQAAKSGTLPARRMGATWVTTLAALTEWVHTRASAATARKFDAQVASHQVPELDYPEWHRIFNENGQERIRPVATPDDEVLALFDQLPGPAYEIVCEASGVQRLAHEFAEARGLSEGATLALPPWRIMSDGVGINRRWYFLFSDGSRLYFPGE